MLEQLVRSKLLVERTTHNENQSPLSTPVAAAWLTLPPVAYTQYPKDRKMMKNIPVLSIQYPSKRRSTIFSYKLSGCKEIV